MPVFQYSNDSTSIDIVNGQRMTCSLASWERRIMYYQTLDVMAKPQLYRVGRIHYRAKGLLAMYPNQMTTWVPVGLNWPQHMRSVLSVQEFGELPAIPKRGRTIEAKVTKVDRAWAVTYSTDTVPNRSQFHSYIFSDRAWAVATADALLYHYAKRLLEKK